jgi:hypothetical protein
MHHEEGSIYSLDTINNGGPPAKIPVLIPILYTQVAPYILVEQYFKPTTISFQRRNVAYNGNTWWTLVKNCESKGKATPLGRYSMTLLYQQTPLP